MFYGTSCQRKRPVPNTSAARTFGADRVAVKSVINVLQVLVTESHTHLMLPTFLKYLSRLNLPETAYTVPPIYVNKKCLPAELEPVWSDGAIRVKKFRILYECYILKIIGHETCKTTMIIIILSALW